jgi:hypothetical protein
MIGLSNRPFYAVFTLPPTANLRRSPKTLPLLPLTCDEVNEVSRIPGAFLVKEPLTIGEAVDRRVNILGRPNDRFHRTVPKEKTI